MPAEFEYWPVEGGPPLYRGRWVDINEEPDMAEPLGASGYMVEHFNKDAADGAGEWELHDFAAGRGIWLGDRIVQLRKQVQMLIEMGEIPGHPEMTRSRYEEYVREFQEAYSYVCLDCKHEHFRADVAVGRIADDGIGEDIHSYVADVTVKCLDCAQAFGFRGPPGGFSWTEPRCQVDGCMISLPLMSPLELQLAGMLPVMSRGPMVYEVHPTTSSVMESPEGNGRRLQLRGFEDIEDGLYRLDSVDPNSTGRRITLSLGKIEQM